MRTLVLGAGGQLGRELMELSWPDPLLVEGLERACLDICDEDELCASLDEVQPDVVLNAAAYSAVDRAESEPELADLVNHRAVARLAGACAERQIALIHVSTDYAFDGRATRPYRPEEEPGPLNAYARSKVLGEEAIRSLLATHIIVRSSWLFSATAPNFVRTLLQRGRTSPLLRVVDDQLGSPTPARSVAQGLISVVQALERGAEPWGTYHLGGVPKATWYELATAIFDHSNCDEQPDIVAISTEEYPTPARRPRYSVLDSSKFEAAFSYPAPDWREELPDVVATIESDLARAASGESDR